MSAIDLQQVEQAIKQYRDPYLDQDLYQMKAVKALDADAGKVVLKIAMPYASEGIHGAMQQILTTHLEYLDNVDDVQIVIESNIHSSKSPNNLPGMANVKNIIAVASGKGGVGKSTTSVNLALALAAEGAKVGILDADIYGPSVGMMLGIADGTRPATEDEKFFIPISAHGIEAMSMAFLVTEETPMVWRGPMASGALQQLLMQSKWQNLDYLIVDMPPGTGDIQLTLSQKVPVSGAVVVTTPQDIALLDCKKGIEMFRKVNIPVLGVVENMSMHCCSNCGHQEPIFGEGGGERIAQQYQSELLAQLPLQQSIREQTDQGLPSVVAEPEGEVAQLYRDMARKLSANLAQLNAASQSPFPEIVISND